MFRQDFTCPALLEDLGQHSTRTGLSPAMARLSRWFRLSYTKATGLVRVRSPLLTESRLMSFPPGTEMFQFPGFASHLCIQMTIPLEAVGFPIRKSTDQSLFAAPHGLSQRTTSFIASHAPRHPLNALMALDRSHYRCPPRRRLRRQRCHAD